MAGESSKAFRRTARSGADRCQPNGEARSSSLPALSYVDRLDRRFANFGDQLMKKKIQKPLRLNRETLTSLNHGDLREPVGAVSQIPNACTSVCSTTACAT